jgi:hypothetical protein
MRRGDAKRRQIGWISLFPISSLLLRKIKTGKGL